MPNILIFTTLLFLSFSSTPWAYSQEPADEVRRVLAAQQKAWNNRDLDTFMEGYWNSPDLTFHSGDTVIQGWEPTAQRYRRRYQSEGREMGTLRFELFQVDLLAPDAAFVRGRFHLQQSTGEQTGLFTLILRRFSEQWRIVHDHTSTE